MDLQTERRNRASAAMRFHKSVLADFFHRWCYRYSYYRPKQWLRQSLTGRCALWGDVVASKVESRDKECRASNVVDQWEPGRHLCGRCTGWKQKTAALNSLAAAIELLL